MSQIIQYLTGLDLEAKSGSALHKPGWWAMLSTMRFAIWVLILLGAMSLVSLFVGELADPKIIEAQPKDAAGAVGRLLFVLFDMGDPFRSWWYRLLLGGLCLSLFACVLERTPIIWRLWSKPLPTDTSLLKDIRSAIVRTSTAQVAAIRAQFSTYFSWRSQSNDLWVGERGRLGLWGPLATHFGLLCIFVGALIGSFASFTTRKGGYAGDMIQLDEMPFTVRVDSFRIKYYPLQTGQWVLAEGEWVGRIVGQNSDSSWKVSKRMTETETQYVSLWDYDLTNHWDNERDRSNIQKFTSYVTIFEDSQAVDKREIAVNDPLRRSGFRLYQSSYDPDEPHVLARFDSVTIAVTDTATQAASQIVLRPGERVRVPGDTISLSAGELLPNFKMDSQFHAYSASADFVNPAVNLIFKGESDFERSGWSFGNAGGHGRVVGKYEYRLKELHGATASQEMATIFEIKKTSGSSILWLGFLVSALGLVLSFYVTHRVIYVEWAAHDDAPTRVTGLSRKTLGMYEQDIARMLERVEGPNQHSTEVPVLP